jgi:tetratricopeptide (TPR) repeat protein
MENIGLLGDILILLGAFFLGFVAGIVFMPLRHLVIGFWHAPGRLLKGTQNVGAKLRQAFRTSSTEQPLDRTGLTGSLAGAVSDVLTLRVRHAEASFREGMAAFDKGDHELARRKFSAAIFWDRGMEAKPLHVLAHLRLGWLDEERGAWSKAKEHYKRSVQLDTDNLEATVRLGMVHFRLGDTGPAIFQFQRALELDPGNLDTHYYLYAIYRQAGMERESLEQLRVVKAGESTANLVELFSRHGDEHFRMARYGEAVDDYELALQFDPDCADLYVALGDLHFLQGQPHTALETWCRGLWVGHSEALAERVLAVAGETVDIWPAINLLRDCLARHPQDGRYHFLLSRLLHRAGEEEESAVLLERAVRLTPQLLAAQEELGDLYSRVGQHAKADATYRAGLGAARAQETVYRCQACGYVTHQEQARCFQCNRWGTLQPMTRREAQARGPAPLNLRERATSVRQSLQAAWIRVAGQLPAGDYAVLPEDAEQ